MKFMRAKTKSCTCEEATPCNDTAWGLLGWSSSLEEAMGLLVGSRKGQQAHGYLSRALLAAQPREGFIPLCAAFIRPSQNPARIWAPQHNRASSGGSDEAGRDSSSRERLHSQGLSALEKTGFGRASQEALRSWALHTGTEWDDKSKEVQVEMKGSDLIEGKTLPP